MTKLRTSVKYTLYGDLDGMSVATLRRLLDDYPDDAVIDVRSETVYSGIGTSDERDFFVFRWEE
jgi:hypothetical protein